MPTQNPPSMTMSWPVMKDASSLARKRASFATSSAVPTRPSGVISAQRRAVGVYGWPGLCQRGVSMSSGTMQLARIPLGPRFLASQRVIPTTAALAAE